MPGRTLKEQLDLGAVSLEIHRYASSGRLVCLLPGLGGGIERFAELGERLADAGHQPVAINPRGAGGSRGELRDLRMVDLADDVAKVIEHFGAPAVVAGNAFGNRVARCLASTRPELVAALVLVCAGGDVPPEPAASAALKEFFDESLSEGERLDGTRRALFAPGHDVPSTFIDPGRSVAAARAQSAATRAEASAKWLAGGTAPMLVVQGVHDRIAPPTNGHRLAQQWPDRVEVVDVRDAGHAVLNEQPDVVAQAIIGFIASRR